MNLAKPITNNEKLSRFETEINGEFAFLDYRFYKGNFALVHTFVPEPARGKGIAPALAKFALEYAKEQNLKIMIYCPYVSKYMKRHPEYEPLVDQQYRSPSRFR